MLLNHCVASLSLLPTRKMGSSPRVQVASEREGSLVTISTPAAVGSDGDVMGLSRTASAGEGQGEAGRYGCGREGSEEGRYDDGGGAVRSCGLLAGVWIPGS